MHLVRPDHCDSGDRHVYKRRHPVPDWLEDGIAEPVFTPQVQFNKPTLHASLGEAIGVLEQQSDLKGLLLRSNKVFYRRADITTFVLAPFLKNSVACNLCQ